MSYSKGEIRGVPFVQNVSVPGVPVTSMARSGGSLIAQLAAKVLANQNLIANVQDFSAVGDGVTDDTAAFAAAMVVARIVIVPWTANGYVINELLISDCLLQGVGHVKLKTPSIDSEYLMRLQNDATISDFTIDGEGTVHRRIEIGSDDILVPHSHNTIQSCKIINCPSNSVRTLANADDTFVLGNLYDNCKALNTDDLWTGTGLIFANNHVKNIPALSGGGVTGDAVLIDQPGSTVAYTGVTINGNTFECSPSCHRVISVARAVGVTITGNTIIGNANVDQLIHIEDQAVNVIISNNTLEFNGAITGIHGSLGVASGGVYGHPADESNCFDVMISNNLLRCGGTGIGMSLQGSQPNEFKRITVVGNHVYNATVPLNLKGSRCSILDNVWYNAAAPINIDTGESTGAGVSTIGHTNIVAGNRYVRQTFPRGIGQGFYFGADKIIREITFSPQAENLAGGGSLGTGGTVTFPNDATNNNARYLRATIGSTVMSKDYRIYFRCRQYNLDVMDNVSVQILTRSSAQTRGRLQISFPGTTMAAALVDLNSGTDFATWKVEGLTRRINSGEVNVQTATAQCQILLLLGQGGVQGDTVDISWIKVAIGNNQHVIDNQMIFTSNGSPEGVITASPGALCLNLAGGATTSMYVKESGSSNTGWVAK
jgi:hypothetical protein